MSRLRKGKSARTSLRAALLAGASIAAIAASGLGATSAIAAPVCTGGSIVGMGSSLQKLAQQNVWGPDFAAEVCNSGKFPTVTYESTGSGAGLNEWNANGAKGSINTGKAFIGSDDAPTVAQIENIRTAANGANLAVIPVAQTAIAIVANPPEGCTVEDITNPDLEKVFRGKFTTWSQITTAEGGAACNSPITRVVRLDGSGTSYQFKNYLSLANTGVLPCIGKTWAELEPNSNPAGEPNTLWPESCTGTTLSSLVRPTGTGGGEEVKKVNATAGAIGYAALPDAKSNSAVDILSVGNNGQKTAATATYASPVGAPGVANCTATEYQVPAEGLKVGTGINVDWSKVFGANASIGSTAYPLCTLTYDLAFNGYQKAGFLQKNEITVHDYLREFVVFAGQTKLEESGTFYAPLPTSAKGAHDVLGAAKYAAGKITW